MSARAAIAAAAVGVGTPAHRARAAMPPGGSAISSPLDPALQAASVTGRTPRSGSCPRRPISTIRRRTGASPGWTGDPSRAAPRVPTLDAGDRDEGHARDVVRRQLDLRAQVLDRLVHAVGVERADDTKPIPRQGEGAARRRTREIVRPTVPAQLADQEVGRAVAGRDQQRIIAAGDGVRPRAIREETQAGAGQGRLPSPSGAARRQERRAAFERPPEHRGGASGDGLVHHEVNHRKLLVAAIGPGMRVIEILHGWTLLERRRSGPRSATGPDGALPAAPRPRTVSRSKTGSPWPPATRQRWSSAPAGVSASARRGIFTWIEVWHNRQRRRSTLERDMEFGLSQTMGLTVMARAGGTWSLPSASLSPHERRLAVPGRLTPDTKHSTIRTYVRQRGRPGHFRLLFQRARWESIRPGEERWW